MVANIYTTTKTRDAKFFKKNIGFKIKYEIESRG